MNISTESMPSAQRSAPSAGRYLHRYGTPDPTRVRLKLYLFSYAGGSAAGVFRNWPAYFDASYDLVAIQLGGRGSRMLDTPELDYRVLVRDIADAILADKYPGRFAMYGHSMGALLAYHVALELVRRGGNEPACLFVSGCKAPHLRRELRNVEHMSDAAFLDELRRLDGTPKAVLDNAELMELLLPPIKADFILLERWYEQLHATPPARLLTMPMVGMCGRSDARCSVAEMGAWQEHIRGTLEVLEYNGGHFFLQSEEAQLVPDVRKRLDMIQRYD